MCLVAQSCPTLCDPIDCSTPGFPVNHYLWSLLKPMSIESVMPSNHLVLCYHLLFLPSTFPSIRVFSSESVLPIRWPKYWSVSFNISPSNEYSELISFRIELFWSPCNARDSQESSPAPQFKSINFLVLSLLYGPRHCGRSTKSKLLNLQSTSTLRNMNPCELFQRSASQHQDPVTPTASKLQCWTPQAKQSIRQGHSLTHQPKWDDREICYKWRSKLKTYKNK